MNIFLFDRLKMSSYQIIVNFCQDENEKDEAQFPERYKKSCDLIQMLFFLRDISSLKC